MRRDVPMHGSKQPTDVAAFVGLIDERTRALENEPVELTDAADRVLAEDVVAPCPVPGFDRAAMDGYAVRGTETFGADAYTPLDFTVIGEALPARPFPGSVGPGQAVRIMTGAPVPAGADAVAPAEIASETPGDGGARVQLRDAVPPGRHVGCRGEDIEAGQVILHCQRLLRPQDLGVLASVGAAL